MAKAPSIKITLLGNPGVDKTKIISRYIDDVYEENNTPNIGANYSEKIINKNGKEYELNIWDTSGQEKFHALGKHFYKDAYIIILVLLQVKNLLNILKLFGILIYLNMEKNIQY